ncbi:MAG: hypothetical protein HQL97_14130 [Magnetococcales bacterium]|nr:hypothetical protein [Magnetococcales bacterium]
MSVSRSLFKSTLAAWVALVGFTPGFARAASWYGAPFSADTVIVSPVDPKDRASGKLHVGADRLRSEGVYQGTRKVLIVNIPERKAYTLMPDKKAYHEGLSEALMPPRPDVEKMPDDPQGPCKLDPQLACTREGVETIHGIQTEKWSVKAKGPSAQHVVRIWVDSKRRIVIRQQPDDGPVMERKLLGIEKIEGRDTERWEITHSFKEKKNSYQQWVDAALRIPVRFGEGRQAAMEITAIREGAQDPALFQLPAGYQQVNPPAPLGAEGPGMPPAHPSQPPADPNKAPRFQ